MDAEVDQWPTAGLLLVGEPGTQAGDARSAHPERLSVVDVAHGATLDLIANELDIVPAAALERDGEHLALLASDPDDLLALLDGSRERLFDQHVLAGAERGDRHRAVKVVRNRDAHGVDVRIRE
jgi:hypothetical protein